MLRDKFGTSWMLLHEVPTATSADALTPSQRSG
jgi:hypothetical protein